MQRAPNPSIKDLSHIASAFAPDVYFATTEAFAMATGLEGIEIEARTALDGLPFEQPLRSVQSGSFTDVDPRLRQAQEALIRSTKKAMKRSQAHALRSGHTILDRSLSWLAAVLAAMVSDLSDHLVAQAAAQVEGLMSSDVRHPSTPEEARQYALFYIANSGKSSLLNWSFLARSPAMRFPNSPELEKDALLNKFKALPAKFADRSTLTLANFELIALYAAESGTDLSGMFEESPDGYDLALDEAIQYFGTDDADQARQIMQTLPGTRVYQWPDGWHVVALTTDRDLKVEGKRLDNCIVDYCAMDVGETTEREVFSFRAPDGTARITFEFEGQEGQVRDVSGIGNAALDLEELLRVIEFRSVYELGTRPDVTALSHVTEGVPVNLALNWVLRVDTDEGVVDVFQEGFYEAVEVDEDILAILEEDPDEDLRFYDPSQNLTPALVSGDIQGAIGWLTQRPGTALRGHGTSPVPDSPLTKAMANWEHDLGISLGQHNGEYIPFGAFYMPEHRVPFSGPTPRAKPSTPVIVRVNRRGVPVLDGGEGERLMAETRDVMRRGPDGLVRFYKEPGRIV